MLLSRHSFAKAPRVTKLPRVARHKSIKTLRIRSSRVINLSDHIIHVQTRSLNRIQSVNNNQIPSNLTSHYQFHGTTSRGLTRRSIGATYNNKITKLDYTRSKQKDWNIPRENENDARYYMDESSKTTQMTSHGKITSVSNEITSSGTYFGKLDHQVLDEKKRLNKKNYCCAWTPLCMIFTLLVALLLISAIATLAVLSVSLKTTTTTGSASILTSLKSTSTSSTTTTTQMSCSFSCLNRTWISSLSLLAKWTFDGDYLDKTNNFNATAVSNPPFVTNGYVNQAVWFNANQYLYTSYIPLASTSFTIEAWVFPTGYPNSNDHSILGLCSNPYNNQCLHLSIRKISSTFHFYFSFFGDNCFGSGIVKLFQWAHVAFVFDIITYFLLIYTNGILNGNCTSATPLLATNTSGSLTIGYIPGIVSAYGSNYFQGYIDHLIISNRVKPSCEILDDATLVTYSNFNSGPLLVDSGPNTLQNTQQSISLVPSGHSLQAITFNNSLSYVQISGLTALGIINRNFSISHWIRPYFLQGILVFVSKTALGTQWSIPINGFATNDSLVGQILDTQVASVLNLSPLTTSVWSHIVLTWSSTNGLCLYINNVLVASLASAVSYTASSAQNYITLGNSPQGSGTCTPGLIPLSTSFNGDMDEFRVYSRELTTDDICALYRN